MHYDKRINYSIVDDDRKAVFTVMHINEMSSRLKNVLMYEDKYNPDWFGLQNHTVTAEDMWRISNTPNLLEHTPNIGKKTLEEISEFCISYSNCRS